MRVGSVYDLNYQSQPTYNCGGRGRMQHVVFVERGLIWTLACKLQCSLTTRTVQMVPRSSVKGTGREEARKHSKGTRKVKLIAFVGAGTKPRRNSVQ